MGCETHPIARLEKPALLEGRLFLISVLIWECSPNCGSELARDSGVSGAGNVACAAAIASRLAPTGFPVIRKCAPIKNRAQGPAKRKLIVVGASLRKCTARSITRDRTRSPRTHRPDPGYAPVPHSPLPPGACPPIRAVDGSARSTGPDRSRPRGDLWTTGRRTGW